MAVVLVFVHANCCCCRVTSMGQHVVGGGCLRCCCCCRAFGRCESCGRSRAPKVGQLQPKPARVQCTFIVLCRRARTGQRAALAHASGAREHYWPMAGAAGPQGICMCACVCANAAHCACTGILKARPSCAELALAGCGPAHRRQRTPAAAQRCCAARSPSLSRPPARPPAHTRGDEILECAPRARARAPAALLPRERKSDQRKRTDGSSVPPPPRAHTHTPTQLERTTNDLPLGRRCNPQAPFSLLAIVRGSTAMSPPLAQCICNAAF